MTAFNRRQKRCMTAIECILEDLHPKKDPKALSAALQHRFVSSSGILESSVYTLTAEDMPEADAQLLRLIPDLTRYTMREQFGDHPMLDNLSSAGEYLKTLYVGVPIEQFNVLYLDHSGRLIQCKNLQKGNVDETPFYIEHLLQDVIFSGADAIVLSHNHPGGTLKPSRADVQCTTHAITALTVVGVMLLDHIIIADDQAISLRGNGFVNRHLWDAQNPSSALLRNWVDVSL